MELSNMYIVGLKQLTNLNLIGLIILPIVKYLCIKMNNICIVGLKQLTNLNLIGLIILPIVKYFDLKLRQYPW